MEVNVFDCALIDRAEECIRQRWPGYRPTCGLFLGSGWGAVSEAFQVRDAIDYSMIAGLGAPCTPGHAGKMLQAEAHGIETIIFQGRRHWHEACGWLPVIIPVYLLKRLGVRIIVLTGSVGGIRDDLRPGDLMVVEDHINFIGTNPLLAVPVQYRGKDFVDLTYLYDRELRLLLLQAAAELGVPITSGVLAVTSGPSYETPAEVKMLRSLGADACGMSVAPEAILAHSLGLRVLACTCITNRAAGLDGKERQHGEVLETIAHALQRIRCIIVELWRRLPSA